jgi:hypothetical protein
MIDLGVWARQPRQNERPFFPQAGPGPETPSFVPGAETASRPAST